MASVPSWISVLLILSYIAPILLIANAVSNVLGLQNKEKAQALWVGIIVFYTLYLTVVGVLSSQEVFLQNEIPPRIILWTALPLFLFYLLVSRTKWFQYVYEHIKLEQLIGIHVFRFIGVFFFFAYGYDIIPKEFAIIGGGGDILTAILVFPVVYALQKKKAYATKWVVAWNIIGLLDIISVLTSATLITRTAIENGEQGVLQFGLFPFSWIPAFAPATIIFLHILIFRKLRAAKQAS